MSDFGDYEPEDAWVPTDPMPLLIDNLLRRLDLLENLPSEHRYGELLDQIEHRLAPWRARQGTLDPRSENRVEDLIEDLAWLRQRDG